MNSKNKIRKTLMLFPLFLCLLILPEIVTADSLSTSAHPAPVSPELSPSASCGSISYQSIQDAINHAPRNATVIIAPGRYTELLTINKTLTLFKATWIKYRNDELPTTRHHGKSLHPTLQFTSRFSEKQRKNVSNFCYICIIKFYRTTRHQN